jgi:endonuclease/exonuclease/phosphatase family metal-dependent hydrolase
MAKATAKPLPVLILLWALLPACRSGGDDALRLATFNIEDFPREERQVEEAFTLIQKLDVPIVAVQEIFDPARFETEAKTRMGQSWMFAHVDTAPRGSAAKGGQPSHHLGVLYDRRRYELKWLVVHEETRLDGGRLKQTLEVGLGVAGASDRRDALRLFVVHLKAGSEGRDARKKQFAQLVRILRVARGSAGPIAVLGDFNATEPADRDDLAAFARGAELVWATENLSCSAFWQRDAGCPTSRLDHVLTWRRPARVEAQGGCAEGCETRARCPIYRGLVSDHCPVVVAFE